MFQPTGQHTDNNPFFRADFGTKVICRFRLGIGSYDAEIMS